MHYYIVEDKKSGTINLSILDFKYLSYVLVWDTAGAINLSILDFK